MHCGLCELRPAASCAYIEIVLEGCESCMTAQDGILGDLKFNSMSPGSNKKGVPMNTRHNYFPLEIHGDLAPLICYFFFFFLAAFFLVAMS